MSSSVIQVQEGELVLEEASKVAHAVSTSIGVATSKNNMAVETYIGSSIKSPRRASAYTQDQVEQLLDLFPELTAWTTKNEGVELTEELFQEALERLVQQLGGTREVARELLRRKELKEAKKAKLMRDVKTSEDLYRNVVKSSFPALEIEARRTAGLTDGGQLGRQTESGTVDTLYNGLLSTAIAEAEGQVIAEAEAIVRAEREGFEVRHYHHPLQKVKPERWESLRSEARVIMTRRLLVGWKMMSEYCPGPECRNCPLLSKDGKVECVVCRGSGNGRDGVYAGEIIFDDSPIKSPFPYEDMESSDSYLVRNYRPTPRPKHSAAKIVVEKVPKPLRAEQRTTKPEYNGKKIEEAKQPNSLPSGQELLPITVVESTESESVSTDSNNKKKSIISDLSNDAVEANVDGNCVAEASPNEDPRSQNGVSAPQTSTASKHFSSDGPCEANSQESEMRSFADKCKMFEQLKQGRDGPGGLTQSTGFRCTTAKTPEKASGHHQQSESHMDQASAMSRSDEFSKTIGSVGKMELVSQPHDESEPATQEAPVEHESDEKIEKWEPNVEDNKQTDDNERAAIVHREMSLRMSKGWSLIDASCPACDMPLIQDPITGQDVCILCGVSEEEELESFKHPRSTASEITDEFEMSAKIRQQFRMQASANLSSKQAQRTSKWPPTTVTVLRPPRARSRSGERTEHIRDDVALRWSEKCGQYNSVGSASEIESRHSSLSPDFDEPNMFPFLKHASEEMKNKWTRLRHNRHSQGGPPTSSSRRLTARRRKKHKLYRKSGLEADEDYLSDDEAYEKCVQQVRRLFHHSSHQDNRDSWNPPVEFEENYENVEDMRERRGSWILRQRLEKAHEYLSPRELSRKPPFSQREQPGDERVPRRIQDSMTQTSSAENSNNEIHEEATVRQSIKPSKFNNIREAIIKGSFTLNSVLRENEDQGDDLQKHLQASTLSMGCSNSQTSNGPRSDDGLVKLMVTVGTQIEEETFFDGEAMELPGSQRPFNFSGPSSNHVETIIDSIKQSHRSVDSSAANSSMRSDPPAYPEYTFRTGRDPDIKERYLTRRALPREYDHRPSSDEKFHELMKQHDSMKNRSAKGAIKAELFECSESFDFHELESDESISDSHEYERSESICDSNEQINGHHEGCIHPCEPMLTRSDQLDESDGLNETRELDFSGGYTIIVPEGLDLKDENQLRQFLLMANRQITEKMATQGSDNPKTLQDPKDSSCNSHPGLEPDVEIAGITTGFFDHQNAVSEEPLTSSPTTSTGGNFLISMIRAHSSDNDTDKDPPALEGTSLVGAGRERVRKDPEEVVGRNSEAYPWKNISMEPNAESRQDPDDCSWRQREPNIPPRPEPAGERSEAMSKMVRRQQNSQDPPTEGAPPMFQILSAPSMEPVLQNLDDVPGQVMIDAQQQDKTNNSSPEFAETSTKAGESGRTNRQKKPCPTPELPRPRRKTSAIIPNHQNPAAKREIENEKSKNVNKHQNPSARHSEQDNHNKVDSKHNRSFFGLPEKLDDSGARKEEVCHDKTNEGKMNQSACLRLPEKQDAYSSRKPDLVPRVQSYPFSDMSLSTGGGSSDCKVKRGPSQGEEEAIQQCISLRSKSQSPQAGDQQRRRARRTIGLNAANISLPALLSPEHEKNSFEKAARMADEFFTEDVLHSAPRIPGKPVVDLRTNTSSLISVLDRHGEEKAYGPIRSRGHRMNSRVFSVSAGSYSSWTTQDQNLPPIHHSANPSAHDIVVLGGPLELPGKTEKPTSKDVVIVGGPLMTAERNENLSPMSNTSESTPFEDILTRCKVKLEQLPFPDEVNVIPTPTRVMLKARSRATLASFESDNQALFGSNIMAARGHTDSYRR